MITLPDRISGAIAALEKGEQVDWQKLADLQALDLARIGRQFAEQAIAYHEQEVKAVEEALKQ